MQAKFVVNLFFRIVLNPKPVSSFFYDIIIFSLSSWLYVRCKNRRKDLNSLALFLLCIPQFKKMTTVCGLAHCTFKYNFYWIEWQQVDGSSLNSCQLFHDWLQLSESFFGRKWYIKTYFGKKLIQQESILQPKVHQLNDKLFYGCERNRVRGKSYTPIYTANYITTKYGRLFLSKLGPNTRIFHAKEKKNRT